MHQFAFVSARTEYCTPDKQVPAPYFRKVFVAKENIYKAKLQICGLGFYEVYLNGNNITKGFLAPYRSNPDHYVYVDEYDVTNKLDKGKNVLGIILGNGMQNSIGGSVWEFDRAPWRGAPRVGFELILEYEDGEIATISSEDEVKTAPSPILFDDLHWGEYYDARREIEGWNSTEFNDSEWQLAIKVAAPKGQLRIAEVEPLKIRQEIKPVTITAYKDGYIYDFGINTAGVCKLTIDHTKVGQKILLQHCETLVDGAPFFDGIRFDYMGYYDPLQEDIYYCSGKGKEEYIPRFTYHGFRYVYVTGIEKEQALPTLLTYLEICSDLKSVGNFSCSDEIANKIQEATVRSDYSNFHYFPTDCPQREKNGWTADIALSAEQMLLNLSVEKSFGEWMRNVYKAMNEEGVIPGIIPTGSWGYDWGNGPAWDQVLVAVPYYTYRYCGKWKILEECAMPLMKYLHMLSARLDENHLVAYGLGDWCQAKKIGADFDTPLVVTDTISTIDIARKAESIYNILGMWEQEQFAKELGDKVTVAFRKHLIDHKTMIVHGDTQTAQAMALYYGMFEETEELQAFEHLLKQIEREEEHIATGVLGGRVIFRLLADKGYADLAYHMITRSDFPSSGNWIVRGATTLWENFFEEGGRILSLNHHFWGDVSAWFYYYPGGIRYNPNGTDTKHVDIKPCFIDKLDYANAKYQSPEGKIEVFWERNDAGISLKVDVPKTMYGQIVLPKEYCLEDGTHTCEVGAGVFNIFKA